MGLRIDNRQERTAAGGMLLAGARVVTRVIDVITLLILARFLLQEDFGLVATALIFVQITEAVFDAPLANLLLRLKSISRRHLDNFFTLALLRGIVIAAIMGALAWPIAAFYEDSRLVTLVLALSLAPALRGLRSPRQVLTARRLNYVPDAIAETTGKLVALIAAASIAITTGSYWAIAAGTIATPAVSALVSFVILPTLPRLDLSQWSLFRGFIGWVMGSQLLSALNWQTDRMVLAKMVSLSQLGLFTVARDLASNTISSVVAMMLAPVTAGLSAISGDNARMSDAYLRAMSAVISICAPLVVGQILLADAVVPLLLGEQWTPAVSVFRVITLSLLLTLFVYPANALFFAAGRPDLGFKRQLLDLIFRVPVTIGLALVYGIMGAAVALILAEAFLVLICAISVRSVTGLTVLRQLGTGVRAYISCAVMAAGVMLLRGLVPPPDDTWSRLILLAVTVPAGGLVYFSTHYLLWLWAGQPRGIEQMANDILKRRILAR